jgi:hypothetical protein
VNVIVLRTCGSILLTPDRPASFRQKTLNWLGILALALTIPVAANAEDGIYTKFGLDLGYAGRTSTWAIYTYGSGTASSHFTALTISSPNGSSQPDQVSGNVALAGDYSDLLLSGYGSLTGDVYKKTTGRVTSLDHSVRIGQIYDDSNAAGTSTRLNGGITSLKNVSIQAAGLTATSGMPTTINTNGSQTNWVFNLGLTGTNITTGANRVYYVPSTSLGKLTMRLTDFVLTTSSTVTFNGTSGMAAVINVSNNFNLSKVSEVRLTGGLDISDVLFNVTGDNSKTSGPLPFSISGGSKFTGTLLAYNSGKGAQRSFEISGSSILTGEVLANQVLVSGSAKVKRPPHVSHGP